jgi:alanine-synthesizing transaminase
MTARHFASRFPSPPRFIMTSFPRIERLPPYVFNITGELKMAARRRGEDINYMSMVNPDGPTPQHIVDKLVEVVHRDHTHG